MNINNLLFFDKNGESYNLTLNAGGYWEGADYFLPISLALFDVSNIFILENTSPGVYKYPVMEPNSRFEIKWRTQDAKDNFFLFTVSREGVQSDDPLYLDKKTSMTINHSDFGQAGSLDLSYPMQVNVAFTPNVEKAYSRVLELFYVIGSTSTKVLELTFYGEGEDEDERFRIWLENFGVKFNREDALLLKDYDLKEGLPDWAQINTARKSLLVTIDQVYPYVGTYKGLMNMLDLLGYREVLRVKEYWQDNDPNSLYYKNYAMVDVTDLMRIGDSNAINIVDLNGQIKKGGKFKKTEFLALSYAFTVASDHYDEDGLPEVVSTTDFSVEEIFFKLHGVKRKLKEEILPINVIIKDVIGEFIYFSKFNLRNWSDTTFVESTSINDDYTVRILQPNVESTQYKIRDLKIFYPKLDGVSEFPVETVNLGTAEPYQNGQVYPVDQVDLLNTAIEQYYDDLTHYEFYHVGETNPLEPGDDTSTKIGCPIILEAYIPDLMLKQLDGITFGDFILSEATTSSTLNTITQGIKYFSCATTQSFNVGSRVKISVSISPAYYMIGTVMEIAPIGFSPTTIKVNVDFASGNASSTGWTINLVDSHYTVDFIKHKNAYEIEWIIDGPNNYRFEWRDTVRNLHKIPHFLPYSGEYNISLKVHDMHSGTSTAHKKITVMSEDPLLEAFVKIQDKFKYDFKSLHNVTVQDLGNSYVYRPYAAVINLNGDNAPISSVNSHYLDWHTYSHLYGVGGPQDQIQVYNPTKGYESLASSSQLAKECWGTGTANGQPTVGDYSNAALRDLKYVTFAEMGYVGDNIDGFYIDFDNLDPNRPSSYLSKMQFGGFSEIEFFMLISTPAEFVSYMELADLPGWKEYRYQVVGNRVKATAKVQDKKNHSILKFEYTLSGVFNLNPYLPSSNDLDISDKTIKLGICTLFQSEMVGPSGPFWLGPSGPWYYGPSGPFYDYPSGGPYWIDDASVIYVGPSGWYEGPSGPIWGGPSVWPDETNLLWPNPSGPNWPNPGSWLFPTIYSNTTLQLGDRIRIRNNSGGYAEGFVLSISDYQVEIDIDLINSIGNFDDFDIAIVKTVYTFEKPDKVFDVNTIAKIQETLLQAQCKLDEDLLFLNCPFGDSLISLGNHTAANAANIRYWIDRGYVSYDTLTGVQTGFLPSAFDENSLNLSNVRATFNTMLVPLHHPIFVIIANLASNIETEWTLFKEDTEIAKVKTPSYFIWRFKEPGKYKLSAKSMDARGNISEVTTDITAVFSLNIEEYSRYVENQLDARKFQMTHR